MQLAKSINSIRGSNTSCRRVHADQVPKIRSIQFTADAAKSSSEASILGSEAFQIIFELLELLVEFLSCFQGGSCGALLIFEILFKISHVLFQRGLVVFQAAIVHVELSHEPGGTDNEEDRSNGPPITEAPLEDCC